MNIFLKLAVAVFAILLNTNSSFAAMAPGSFVHATWTGGATSVTRSFNNVAGNCMIVWLYYYDLPGKTTSITYAGNAMTFALESGYSGASPGEHAIAYILNAPATGTNNLVASFSTSVDSGNIVVQSFTGCAASALGNTNKTTDTESVSGTTPTTVSISMTADSVAVSGIYRNETTEVITNSGSQVPIHEGIDVSGGNGRIAASYLANATQMQYTWASGGVRRVAMGVVELKAAASGGSPQPIVQHRVIQ